MCPQVTLTSALTPAAAPAPAPPFSDVSLVGESPSRIEQINYNVVSEYMYVCMYVPCRHVSPLVTRCMRLQVGGGSICDSPGLQRTGTVKDNYIGSAG